MFDASRFLLCARASCHRDPDHRAGGRRGLTLGLAFFTVRWARAAGREPAPDLPSTTLVAGFGTERQLRRRAPAPRRVGPGRLHISVGPATPASACTGSGRRPAPGSSAMRSTRRSSSSCSVNSASQFLLGPASATSTRSRPSRSRPGSTSRRPRSTRAERPRARAEPRRATTPSRPRHITPSSRPFATPGARRRLRLLETGASCSVPAPRGTGSSACLRRQGHRLRAPFYDLAYLSMRGIPADRYGRLRGPGGGQLLGPRRALDPARLRRHRPRGGLLRRARRVRHAGAIGTGMLPRGREFSLRMGLDVARGGDGDHVSVGTGWLRP